MAKAAIAKYDPGLHGHGETAHDVRGVCGEAESFERRMICNGAVRSVLRAARTEERVREGGGAAVGKAGQVGDEEMHQNGKRKKKSHAQVQSQEFQQAGIVVVPQPPSKTGAKAAT